jgi:hypothetical protein
MTLLQDGCVREISRSVWLRLQWQRGRRFAACPACKGAGSYLIAAKVLAAVCYRLSQYCVLSVDVLGRDTLQQCCLCCHYRTAVVC